MRTDGTGIIRLTAYAGHGASTPDISGDGELVVWSSPADPLGTNPENNSELYLYERETASLGQLTFTARGDNSDPRFSGDGAWLYFLSSAPIFGEVPPAGAELHRVELSSGTIERFHGLRDPRSGLFQPHVNDRCDHAVDFDGDRVILAGTADLLGDNPDGSDSVWILDATAPGRVHPSVATPTEVRRDVDPRYVRYDVIRADVAQLTDVGASIDLGPVVCLEDDSPDAHTQGFADPLAPASGQVFFYVWRGTQGLGDGPGSWGRSSGGQERLAGAGSCSP